jgi:ribonuclease BN (tRNA processing enzyme)
MLEVLFCGAGDAFCSAGQLQAGYLLARQGTRILLDCGVTTLAALHRHGEDVSAIDVVVLSHLHGDHFGGLPFLFLEWTYQSRRTRPLEIVGPPGTAERVASLFRTLYRDVSSRPLPFAVRYREILPEEQMEVPGGSLQAFRVPHQEQEVSLGFDVTIGGRRVVYSGDTGWTPELLDRSADADLFICECSFYDTIVPNHLAYTTLAGVRHQLRARRTILTHLGREVLARRNEVDFELAHDGLRVTLG